ncbi:MAG: DUF1446 domain-containing protein [Bacteroidetes bacterium]|nr:DUF1446 domain-containing protein [Bacteroidota bacterium]
MKLPFRIANAQGFWGDRPNAASTLLKLEPKIDFLTLDYLAEVSLSIMAIQKEKDKSAGYARDFVSVVRSLIPFWKKGSKVKIVTNSGGMNPQACANECLQVLQKEGIKNIKIGILGGDDVTQILKKSPKNKLYKNLETGKSLKTVVEKLVTANAYLGAEKIVDLLNTGADIVITGRIADPSLTVAPAVYNFNWDWKDYDKLAQATVAGHLIECGTQVTGGISTHWLSLDRKKDFGFPIIEMNEDGSFIITKPKKTSGEVSERTVKEQLVYEIGDPQKYISPDVNVSFLNLKLNDEKNNRVNISGASGAPPPETLKVSATYKDGWKCEATLAIFGDRAEEKAKLTGELILKRIENAGFKPERSIIECIGSGGVVPHLFETPKNLRECMLRIAVADQNKEKLEYFSKEIAPLVTSGPQGVTGYISGRPKVRPIYSYWPCLIDKSLLSNEISLIST